MDEYFKKEDEITLAGIARQDVELYGESAPEPRSVWRRIRDAVRSFLGGSSRRQPPGNRTTGYP